MHLDATDINVKRTYVYCLSIFALTISLPHRVDRSIKERLLVQRKTTCQEVNTVLVMQHSNTNFL